MTFLKVLSVTELRERLPQAIKEVSEPGRRRVYVGPHRRPEAVLMGLAADMPDDIREMVLAGFFARQADTAIRAGARRGEFSHVGDEFGKVFAWLWRVDRHEALDHLAGYLVALRRHPDSPTPPVRLDDVLGALGLAADITDDEYAAICDRARRAGIDPTE
ncbi:hypothetical protein [Nocardia paucivorans]|uniref:hypothetical protein n=1 Tax=Nocardia paucivorans TaxID=114259 RepID=UPI000593C768|nr:hypothetical protein [Nocardia paucivorans]